MMQPKTGLVTPGTFSPLGVKWGFALVFLTLMFTCIFCCVVFQGYIWQVFCSCGANFVIKTNLNVVYQG
jgi:hypothetical protein